MLDDAVILEYAFDQSPLALAIYDHQGNLRRANDLHVSFVRALGSVTGVGDFNVLAKPRSDHDSHRDHFRRAYNGEPIEYSMSCHRQGDESGEMLHFRRLLVPVCSLDGSTAAVVSVIVDVTEQRQAEEEQARFHERLQQAQRLESLGLLAGGIAHDFNNLLVSVLGNVTLLSKGLEKHSPLRSYAVAIETAAKRAADVARQMLAYAGKSERNVEHVYVSELAEEISELLRVSVSRGAELRCELTQELPPVHADATQLRQLLMNLITNASEALIDGQGSIVVRTGWFEPSAEYLDQCIGAPDLEGSTFVYVEVQDGGCGMDARTAARLFDPFFTTKSVGRGLGLSAVLGIVRAHRGALWVQSAPGMGTTIRALLPAATPASEPHPSPPPLDDPSAPLGHRVLVVDDDANVRQIARSMLEQLGCDVYTVDGGQAALETWDQATTPFTTVLLDVTMPGLSGIATLQHLRTRDPTVRAVLMSGYGASDSSLDTEFLPKPFSLDELRRALERARPKVTGRARATDEKDSNA